MLVITMLLLASCDSIVPATPTATLRGAFVPTRIPTETPTMTSTPSRTPTPTVTRTPTSTNTSALKPTTTDAITSTPSRPRSLTSTPRLLLTSASPTAGVMPTSAATLPATEQRLIGVTATLAVTRIELDDVSDFTYSGTIDRRSIEFNFVFEGEEGAIFNIQMVADTGDLDPYLLLLDENGSTLIENDDDPLGSGRDAYIRDFALPDDGRYVIIAGRFRREQGRTTGDFTLRVSQPAARAEVTALPDATEPAPDTNDETIIEGVINDATPTAEFTIEVEAPAIIEIELTALSGNLDAYLLVLDATGEILIENDDAPQGSGRDAYIRQFQLPKAGQYTIVATRFQQAQGSTSGDFRLRYVILDE